MDAYLTDEEAAPIKEQIVREVSYKAKELKSFADNGVICNFLNRGLDVDRALQKANDGDYSISHQGYKISYFIAKDIVDSDEHPDFPVHSESGLYWMILMRYTSGEGLTNIQSTITNFMKLFGKDPEGAWVYMEPSERVIIAFGEYVEENN